jgi:hypothetical protein
MNEWYMKLFWRLLNSTVQNAQILFWESTGRRIEQLSSWVQLMEGLKGTELKLNTKYQGDICLMIWCHGFQKSVSLGESCQQISLRHRDVALCAPSMERGGTQYSYRNNYAVSVREM